MNSQTPLIATLDGHDRAPHLRHRMKIQYDAQLHFDLDLPPNDDELIRDQTPLSVVIEHSDVAEECAVYHLKIRVGEGGDAQDYLQAKFVHKSAAEGAAKCLLQYLSSKKKLNVVPEVVSPLKTSAPLDKQTFVAVGWKIAKR